MTIILILSFIITFITFCFSAKVIDFGLIKTYFQSPLLLILNMLPVFIFILFIYIIIGRLWIGYSITTIIFVGLASVNKFKLMYRDDPILFSDLFIIREALKIGERYNYLPTFIMFCIYGALTIIAILLFYCINKIKVKILPRFMAGFLIVIASFILYNKVYINQNIYNNLGNKKLINIWSSSQQFQIRGFIYPFIYSSQKLNITRPNNYNHKDTENDLKAIADISIPYNQKVNIISIMLEAYNDFSIFEGVEFNIDVYKNYKSIKEEAISGNIITNVFGGGTINAERSYLTGFFLFPNFRARTNSFVWYLKNQGYYTEAMHPIYGWFYSRHNVNFNLGFDNYDYYENKYADVQYAFLNDIDFFKYIIEGYENNKQRKQPYFNFSVTYQNHGPYTPRKQDKEYLKNNSNIDEETYNLLNTYFSGIYNTDIALGNLMDYFSNEQEPVIILIFSDHNPYFGPNHEGYKALGIDFNQNNLESFINQYRVPYIIWANQTTKEIFNKDFIGEGATISPNYLMVELFDQLGYKGNNFMQVLSNLKTKIPVINEKYYKEGNEWVKQLSSANQSLYDNYLNVNYYMATNFLD